VTEAELESWLYCLKVEYIAGDLTLEKFESEVWRFLTLYEIGEAVTRDGYEAVICVGGEHGGFVRVYG
jgi:hypothetical protein